MDQPKVPSSAELERADKAMKGGAELLLKRYLSSLDTYELYHEKVLSEEIKSQKSIHVYRLWSILSGTFLAISSLLLCAYAINQKADILSIAAILGPVAGVAGVFVWGYKPKEGKASSEKAIKQITDAQKNYSVTTE